MISYGLCYPFIKVFRMLFQMGIENKNASRIFLNYLLVVRFRPRDKEPCQQEILEMIKT